MESKLVAELAGERRFVLVFDAGEEALAIIAQLATQEKISGASLTARGAFERAVVGWSDVGAKSYREIFAEQQCEGLSLIGDIAEGDDGKLSLGRHAVVGLSDGSTRGGHLVEEIVRPTREGTVVETLGHLRRKKHADLGVPLISLQ